VVASTFREKETRWFWEPWFAFDVLNVLVGRKNVGKSSLVAKLMAMAKRPIILPGFEEDVERMMMPRWRVAGVNLDNLKVLNDQPYSPQLMKDLFVKILRDWGADLFVVEMMDSYLPDEKSENNSQDVRPFLEALREIAERSGACVVGTRHPGKDAENIMRGSQAWENVPRIIVTLETFEGPPVRRWMSSHQCGVAEKPPAVSYELRREGKAPPVFIPGELADPKAVELAKATPDQMDRLAIDLAREMLVRFLGDGRKEAKDVYAQAEKERLSDRTMRRGARLLDVIVTREGQGANHKVYWSLP